MKFIEANNNLHGFDTHQPTQRLPIFAIDKKQQHIIHVLSTVAICYCFSRKLKLYEIWAFICDVCIFQFSTHRMPTFFFCYIDASHSHIWNYYYPIYCWMLFNPNRVLANWKPKNSMLFIKYFISKLYRIRGLQRGFFLYRVLWILTMHVVVVVWYLPILIHHSGFYIQ